jgi:predicted GNAT family acetyltransferase
MRETSFHDNEAQSRFELREADGTVTADYERRPGTLVIRYVYAPPPLRGTGASDRLMSEVAGVARAEERKVLALCGFARRWLQSRKAHRDLLTG